ncbi:pyridoxamine 5'-phosphate oxidase family protein [Microbacterium sp. LWH3-1.2]|uniref:pyridoxamine 5'-phosphate oxidase family protein n=1 Tax=Microbacterium sp. LWH3-1.2 TaxID=3135256 RepID=UPI00343D966B
MNDSPPADRTPGVEHLPASTCWEYVQQARLGRLAVINADGAPDIFPVNHLAHEGALFIRTARDPKLLHIAHHPAVAFEVDGQIGDAYWSVVIRGVAERATREDELRDSGVRRLASWSPTLKLFVIKVVVNTITGRRFPVDAGHADRVIAFEPEATTPPPERAHPVRGERPEPIPHFVPRTGPNPVVPDEGPDL